jgi:hypothetical protein
VAEPPAELGVVEEERGGEGRAQEGEADDDEQVGPPAREQERVHGADGQEGVEREPDGEGREREGAARFGNVGDDRGLEHPDSAEDGHAGQEHALEHE